jgi:hypothetical protein
MSLDLAPAFADFRPGENGKAYNEAAFRHFLAVDRRRARRAKRSLLLILVTVRHDAWPVTSLGDETAAALFAGLRSCTREVDFVGWYREGRVAAAVMTQGAAAPADLLRRVADRTRIALTTRLSADQARNLRLRVVRLGTEAF